MSDKWSKFMIQEFNDFLNVLHRKIDFLEKSCNETIFDKKDVRYTFFMHMQAILWNYVLQMNQIITIFYLAYDFEKKFALSSEIDDEELKPIFKDILDNKLNKGDENTRKDCIWRNLILLKQESFISYFNQITFAFLISYRAIFEGSILKMFDSLYPSKSEDKKKEIVVEEIKKIQKILDIDSLSKEQSEWLEMYFDERQYQFDRKLKTICKDVEWLKIDSIIEVYNQRNTQHNKWEKKWWWYEVITYEKIENMFDLIIDSFIKIINHIKYDNLIEDTLYTEYIKWTIFEK